MVLGHFMIALRSLIHILYDLIFRSQPCWLHAITFYFFVLDMPLSKNWIDSLLLLRAIIVVALTVILACIAGVARWLLLVVTLTDHILRLPCIFLILNRGLHKLIILWIYICIQIQSFYTIGIGAALGWIVVYTGQTLLLLTYGTVVSGAKLADHHAHVARREWYGILSVTIWLSLSARWVDVGLVPTWMLLLFLLTRN